MNKHRGNLFSAWEKFKCEYNQKLLQSLFFFGKLPFTIKYVD